jgi:hypothetical protein
MALKNGQSSLDSITIRLVDLQKEITNCDSFNLSSEFLTPTDKVQFKVSNEDVLLVSELLVPPAKIDFVINDRVQFTGYIDSIHQESDREGGNITIVTCRDILGRVVSSNTDFEEEYTSQSTVLDVLQKNLPQYGIEQIYNDDQTNINIMTGFAPGKGKNVKITITQKTTIGFEKNADKSFKLDSKHQKIPITKEKKVTTVTAALKPGLKTLTLEHLKPKPGEGEYAFIDRILKRHGLIMRAAADGSGVIVDKPNFDGPSIFNIFHKSGELDSINNVIKATKLLDFGEQPSLIIAMGFGGGKKSRKSQLKTIMVNELIGVDENGTILPEVQTLINKHPGFKPLPIRKELVPNRKLFGSKPIPCWKFIKDEESKSQDQLDAFVKRKMAEYQQKGLVMTYIVEGWTQNGYPWCLNTIVDVDDDVNNIHERMWILNRRFDKTKSGTRTTLTLIRPYTLSIG